MTELKPDLVSHAAVLTDAQDLRAYEDVMHCNRCGFCTSFCPTYLATGDEGLSPRGRNQSLRALLEGRLSPQEGQRFFDTCLTCGICTSVCFAQVPTARLMVRAREKVRKSQASARIVSFFFRWVLPRPRVFEPFLKVLFFWKRLGVSSRLNKWGILGLVHPRLKAAEEVLDTVSLPFVRDTLTPAEKDVEVIQFLACGSNCLSPEVGRATAHLLKVAGVKSGAGDTVCCGLPAQSYGDLDAARRMARVNIERLERFPQAVVLVDDSSCAAMVKDWPELFEADPLWRERAVAVSHRTKDLLQWLDENRQTLRSKLSVPAGVVTYHDSCKARFGQGLVDEPRRVLKTHGVDVREMAEADSCCGGAGAYQFMQAELSRSVGDRKTKRILESGAGVVLTSSVSCLLSLRAGLKRAGSSVKAFHISEFLATPPK